MTELLSDEEILFSVETPLGFRVRTTVSYWTIITTIKHPVMVGREADVQATLRAPDEVRLSRTDEQIYLFYRSDGAKRWVCVISKRLNGEGYIVTAYRTSGIKEGIHLWPK
jgi:hypothetical protein